MLSSTKIDIYFLEYNVTNINFPLLRTKYVMRVFREKWQKNVKILLKFFTELLKIQSKQIIKYAYTFL